MGLSSEKNFGLPLGAGFFCLTRISASIQEIPGNPEFEPVWLDKKRYLPSKEVPGRFSLHNPGNPDSG